MGDQWTYNYPPPNTPNYVYPSAATNPPQYGQYNQWPQNQYPTQGHQQCTYQPISSYPPASYNVPPPAPQQTFAPYANYPSQYEQYQAAAPPNDYVKELENYKYIKSRINEVDGDLEGKAPSRSVNSFRKSRSPSPKNSRGARRRSRSRSGDRRGYREGKGRDSDGRSYKYSRRSSRSPDRGRSRGRSRERDRRRSRERSPRDYRGRSSGSPRRSASSSSTRSRPSLSQLRSSERDQLLSKWRSNYCSTEQQLTDRLEQLAALSVDDIVEKEKSIWTRSTPAELFYERCETNLRVIKASPKLVELCEEFKEKLVSRARKVNATKEKYEPPPRKNRARLCKHKTESHSSSESSDDDNLTDEEDCTMEELQRKQQHPDRLHPEMWYNEPGEMNDGPLCRCSVKSRKSGIRHGIYPGEVFLEPCLPLTNNAGRLHHYRITISPPTNFLVKTPTIIHHDEHEFIFEGFSLLSHFPLEKLPSCRVIRFNIEYTILSIEEKIPENFTVLELDLFTEFLFQEVLELVDLDLRAAGQKDGCPQFHFMPRFVRELPDNGKEILCMKEVLKYLLGSSQPLIEEDQLGHMIAMSQYEWQSFADEIKGMVVTYPGKKPCSVRVDQLDRNIELQKEGAYMFPEIVHFGIRPPQLSYAGNPEYQKAWRDYVKFRHLLANMSKPTYEDKRKLEAKENKLQEMRTQGKMKRDVTVAVSAKGFYKTGIMCDIIQHAMLIPVLVCHLRFHHSLNALEESIAYTFENRALLQLALTHPSYRENFGTNPDHARNSLTNCGIRQPEYGDRRIHYMNTRKRGINTLINIMSRFGKQYETESNITHNERLEFLGDAVVEFLSSIHLFFSFPDLEEGGLATYRAAIVQNQHLSVLAKILKLDQFMLYAHGSDLCHDLELRHAMANCFEALMGALFLDGGIEVADQVFSLTFLNDKPDLHEVWVNIPAHPLQEQEPSGDRHWIEKFELLQSLVKFEQSINVEFTHIRLLARAFTDRSVGYTNLTMGSNQRLEFLGDTVLQLIASEYLYKFFPEHHEGHLSLLRSSLVNNRTQAVVCDDLDMSKYAVYNNPKAELKTKDRADLLEAFIGALYVDQGMKFCEVFCQVTLFPRLQDFIMNQDWNDPKSKLQQCCLTLRTMDGGEPDIPVYKVIECKGPTNTRVYTVAVYFRGRRLASAMGHSIQQAEMNAAKKALEISQNLFPQLDHQKRVIAKSMKIQKKRGGTSKPRSEPSASKSPESYSRNRFRKSSSASSSSASDGEEDAEKKNAGEAEEANRKQEEDKSCGKEAARKKSGEEMTGSKSGEEMAGKRSEEEEGSR